MTGNSNGRLIGRSEPTGLRQGRAGLSDLRLWAGVGLLVLSVVAGALLMGRTDRTVTVWRATRDLGVGAIPASLEPVAVPAEWADGTYISAASAPDGRLRWPVPAGALVPAAAMAESAPADLRRVTVPVDPLHAPVDLQVGDLVDVWWTAGDDRAATAAGPELVLASVPVFGVTSDAVGLGGEQAVVLEVPTAEVAALVRASRSGRIDLVSAGVSAGEPVA